MHDNEDIGRKDLMSIAIFAVLYFSLFVIFELNITIYTEIQIGIAILLLLIMINKNKLEKRLKRCNLYHVLVIMVLIIGILSSVKYKYDIEGESYISQFLDKGELKQIVKTSNYKIRDFNKVINYISKRDNGFFKVSRYPYTYEASNFSLMNKKYQSIGHYYSITPDLQGNLNKDLENQQYYTSKGAREFDYRTKITTLLGVKYCVISGNGIVPYGYSRLEDYKGKSKIYENNYNLPFGVLYDNYITKEEYENLNAIQKEDSLLKATVLEENIIQKNLSLNHLKYDNSVRIQKKKDKVDNIEENNITVKNTNRDTLKLDINGIKNSEIYVLIKGIKYNAYSANEMVNNVINKDSTVLEKERAKRTYKWYQPNYGYEISVKYDQIKKVRKIENYLTSPYYIEDKELLFNMGYYDNTEGTITIQFSKVGNYSWDDIEVFAVSMEDYEEDINALRKSNFEVTSYGNGYMNGKVNAEKDGVLQFSTIYNKGWKVYVDNKEVETFISNNYFLGIEVTQGEHTIYMKYTVPYLKEGMIISLVGIILLIGSITLGKGIMKRKEQGK